ncbi:hypothetical protein TIFTF001_040568 [Ficus carica]|uniref:Uncharacterized protein n=1 Tax=Ficus carica TaxID=3494 RepID=A0AA87Z3D7_FICCA|nr:hypothetical protein TIFTF001_040568 [Ficus carica]
MVSRERDLASDGMAASFLLFGELFAPMISAAEGTQSGLALLRRREGLPFPRATSGPILVLRELRSPDLVRKSDNRAENCAIPPVTFQVTRISGEPEHEVGRRLGSIPSP